MLCDGDDGGVHGGVAAAADVAGAVLLPPHLPSSMLLTNYSVTKV